MKLRSQLLTLKNVIVFHTF